MTDNDVESQLKHINQNVASMQQWIANLEEGQKAALAEMRAAAKGVGRLADIQSALALLAKESSLTRDVVHMLVAGLKERDGDRLIERIKRARAAWRSA